MIGTSDPAVPPVQTIKIETGGARDLLKEVQQAIKDLRREKDDLTALLNTLRQAAQVGTMAANLARTASQQLKTTTDRAEAVRASMILTSEQVDKLFRASNATLRTFIRNSHAEIEARTAAATQTITREAQEAEAKARKASADEEIKFNKRMKRLTVLMAADYAAYLFQLSGTAEGEVAAAITGAMSGMALSLIQGGSIGGVWGIPIIAMGIFFGSVAATQAVVRYFSRAQEGPLRARETFLTSV